MESVVNYLLGIAVSGLHYNALTTWQQEYILNVRSCSKEKYVVLAQHHVVEKYRRPKEHWIAYETLNNRREYWIHKASI